MTWIESDPIIWVLLHDAVLLVDRYTKSMPEAERLILEYANKGHFTELRFNGEQCIAPRSWGAHHPNLGLYIVVDFPNSTVTRLCVEPTEYLLPEMLDEILNELPKPLRPSGSLQMHLVCLAHHELVSMLHKVGLLEPSDPPPPPPSPPMPEPRGAPEATSETEEGSRPEPAEQRTESEAENPEWPSAEVLGITGNWQQEMILATLPELYTKHPEQFDDRKVYKYGGRRLVTAVGNLWAIKARAEGKPPPAAPSEDTGARLLAIYRAWDARRRAH